MMRRSLARHQSLQPAGAGQGIKLRPVLLVLSLALSAAVVAVRPAAAQYPSKPIRLIVPFAAGGPSDAAARSLGRALSKSIGQSIVVDNVPGANGAIALRTARNAPSEGYTLLWGVGSMVAIPLLEKSAALEVIANLAPISMVGQFAFGIATNPGLPVNTIDQFVSYAHASPGKISFASATLGEFMVAAQFMKASGTSMTRVPYKGGAQVMPDLLAGRVQAYFGPVSLALPHLSEGKLRMLGILLPQRSPAVPDVPTMAEVGMPSVTIPSWQAVFGPPKTPRDILNHISREVNRALHEPDVVAQFNQLMLAAGGSTPDMLAVVIRQDLAKWREFIRENGVSQE
jgi:tripartite-type tricarboxylate transporter receptor subunit TctC